MYAGMFKAAEAFFGFLPGLTDLRGLLYVDRWLGDRLVVGRQTLDLTT